MAETITPTRDTSGWLGHPRGLSTLFFTEMWERFSYYGMRAFLILYMTAPIAEGGLGFSKEKAGPIYGFYTGSVWMAAIGGGLIADWILGQYRSVLLGGTLIMLGHISLAFPPLPFFYAGLGLIIVGTGLLKPNVSTIVGSLYEDNDERRDAGFSVFYMGINLGAAIGPIIAGYLAQKVNWHIGFGCAAVGMAAGLIQYVLGRNRLKPAIERIAARKKPEKTKTEAAGGFTTNEWKRLGAIVVLFVFATIFWAVYEQAGSTLNLFAQNYTRLNFLGIDFVASQLQSVPAIFVIVLAPIFAWMWIKLGSNEPSSPAKFAFGLIFVALSFLLLVPGSTIAQTGVRVSPLWLVGVYFLQVCGELALSPVGMSVVTKLAPQRIVGLMMGVWFLSISFGDIIAGKLAASELTPQFFRNGALVAMAAGIILFLLVKPIRKLMGGIR